MQAETSNKIILILIPKIIVFSLLYLKRPVFCDLPNIFALFITFYYQ